LKLYNLTTAPTVGTSVPVFTVAIPSGGTVLVNGGSNGIRFATCMQLATMHLVEEFHASVGYTQSDEITLAWFLPAGGRALYPFDGRFQKLTSVTAGLASTVFSKAVALWLPAKANAWPCFDARAWQVPTLADALEVFLWREDDATKNSVQMAARAVASHKQLDGKGRKDQLGLLEAAGVRWNDYPDHFKRGAYFQRVTRLRTLTLGELDRIPAAFRPPEDQQFERSSVERLTLRPLRHEPDALALLFPSTKDLAQ
jgi:tRNA(His) 5'-end guanylyltransferase